MATLTLDVIFYFDDAEQDEMPTREVRIDVEDVDFADLVQGDEDSWITVVEEAQLRSALSAEWVVSHAINVVTNETAMVGDYF